MDTDDFQGQGSDRYGLNDSKILFSNKMDWVGFHCKPTIY